MKKLPVTAVALLFAVATLAAQEEQTVLQQENQLHVAQPKDLQPHDIYLSFSGAYSGVVNSQPQRGFPLQIEFQRFINQDFYWGIIGQYASRKDEWVVGDEHYNDEHDQQMFIAMGTVGLHVPIIDNRVDLQLTLGAGAGRHIMKHGELYPDKTIFYIHLGHWWRFRLNKFMYLKIIPLLSSKTFAPFDAGAPYSHHPNLKGSCSIGLEFKLN